MEQEQQNQRLCDAADCKEIATKEVKIRAGRFGEITLLLCDNCVCKFEN